MSTQKKVVQAKEEKIQPELTLLTLINSTKRFVNYDEIDLEGLKEYLECEISKDVAKYHLEHLEAVYKKLDEWDLNEDNKVLFKKAFGLIALKCVESESRGLLVEALNDEKEAYKKAFEDLRIEYQKERDEHNNVLLKFNQKLKPPTIDDIEFKLVSYDKNKKFNLTTNRFKTLSNGLNIYNLSPEKFTRIPSQKETTKVDRAYAKLK